MAEALADLSELLKRLQTRTPALKGFRWESGPFTLHYPLTSQPTMEKRNTPSEPPGTCVRKQRTLKRSLRQVHQEAIPAGGLVIKGDGSPVRVSAPEDPPGGRGVEWETVIPRP